MWKHVTLGLLAGLCLGMAVGWLAGQASSAGAPVPVYAVATHGQENTAICTAPIDESIEAIVTLDALTGDLKASVLSLQTGKFNALIEYNVVRDLVDPETKNAKFLLVSGLAELRRGGPFKQPSRSVIYVAEMVSGRVAAYAIPWTPGRAATGAMQRDTFFPLDRWQFRTTAVRDTESK
jgi:hypothetical protein